jgi:alpha-1,3-glucosyltransferase
MKISARPDENFYVLTLRVSVIVSDLIFFYSCVRMTQVLKKGKMFLCALYINWGLVILDNVHFQYNSMMYGIMVLSIVYMFEKKWMKSAFCFAVLINFKHIYLYSAPAFGLIYLKE